MPQIYKVLTATLAFTGCIGLVITGQLNPLMFTSIIALIVGYVRFYKGMSPLSKWTIGGLSIATLILFAFDALIMTGDAFIAVAHLTIIFQAIKSFDLKEPWDHLQVYFMSLLQLIIASELTKSMAFGVIFVFFLIALVTAMVISHFLQEGTIRKIKLKRPVIIISILTLIITGIFFISAPRTKGGLWGKSRTKGIKTVGFSEKVYFGSFGEVKLDPTVVMRIEMQETTVPLYWRGITLDFFDGMSWKNTIQRRISIHKTAEQFRIRPLMNVPLIQKIYAEPIDTDVVFGLAEIAAVESPGTILFKDEADSLYLPAKKDRRLLYTIFSALPSDTTVRDRFRYLQMPHRMERVAQLAQDIIRNEHTDNERTIAIERFLKTNYNYSLTTNPPPKGLTPIEDFLFNTKQGYCEHYATAMVLLLRTVGIPSRIVTGFIGGERNEYGGYIIVRQSDAHSWVEAAIDGTWKRFDPTPPAPMPEMPSLFVLYIDSIRMKWYRYIVNFSSSDQKKLIEYITMPFIKIPEMPEFKLYGFKTLVYTVFVISGVAIIIFLLKRLRIYRYGFITANYIKFRDSLKRRGADITMSSTPSDVLKEALRLGMGAESAEFIKLYEKARFGGSDLNDEEKKRYKPRKGS